MRQRLLILGSLCWPGVRQTHRGSTAPQAPKAINDNRRGSAELTVAWDNYGRGGAALRQPAFVQRVGQDGSLTSNIASTTSENHFLPAPILTPGDIAATMTAFEGSNPAIAKATRLARFPAGSVIATLAKGWTSTTGALSMPRCNECAFGSDHRLHPPVHTSHGYLQAWTHFCTKSKA